MGIGRISGKNFLKKENGSWINRRKSPSTSSRISPSIHHACWRKDSGAIDALTPFRKRALPALKDIEKKVDVNVLKERARLYIQRIKEAPS
jgi:hypothetical protein